MPKITLSVEFVEYDFVDSNIVKFYISNINVPFNLVYVSVTWY